MASDLNIISAIVLELIKMLKPDQRKKIQSTINELEEEHEEERQRFLAAIKGADIDTLNVFIHKYMP